MPKEASGSRRAYLAYRSFRLIPTDERYLLASSWKGGPVSWDQETLSAEAKCLRGYAKFYEGVELRPACFKESCQDGLYAWASPTRAWEKKNYALGPNPDTVLAATAHWGTVECHDELLRSEHALVLALFYPEHWNERQHYFHGEGLFNLVEERDVPLLPSISDFFDRDYARAWAKERKCAPYLDRVEELKGEAA